MCCVYKYFFLFNSKYLYYEVKFLSCVGNILSLLFVDS